MKKLAFLKPYANVFIGAWIVMSAVFVLFASCSGGEIGGGVGTSVFLAFIQTVFLSGLGLVGVWIASLASANRVVYFGGGLAVAMVWFFAAWSTHKIPSHIGSCILWTY